MHVLKFLISKVFLINLLIALLLGFGLLWGFFQYLEVYTHHNESLSVPDLKGKKVKEAKKALNDKNMRMEISDSVYVPGKQPKTVIEQHPRPLSKVKRNRKIYLTLNTTNPPKVELPDLKDVSLRQALKILKNHDLKAGELKYVPGIAKNAVKRMELNGEQIKAGKDVPKGTAIDLVLEGGETATKVDLPNLKGRTLDETRFFLKASGLNVGAVVYDSNIVDSSKALIYQQAPEYQPQKEIPQGEAIDVWLTKPEQYDAIKMGKTNKDSASIENDE